MNRSTILTIALLSAGIVTTHSAMALKVKVEHAVFITSADGEVFVGEWSCHKGKAVIPQGGVSSCRYRCTWTNADETDKAKFVIDEETVPGFSDCKENSQLSINTIIVLAPAAEVGPSFGFDTDQTKQQITALVIAASSTGEMAGTIVLGSDVSSIRTVEDL